MFDTESSSFFLGDDASFQKKEVELAKRLVCHACEVHFWHYIMPSLV